MSEVLPFTVDAELRLRLEAIVFAADMIAFAHEALVSLAVSHGRSQINGGDTQAPGLEGSAMVGLFQQAWSIVDHIHELRQLLPTLGVEIEGATEFVADFESATLMRNRMDHPTAQIANLAKAKGVRPPLYGALGYVLALPEHAKDGQIERGYVVFQHAGAVQPGQKMGEIRIPGAFYPPAFDFTLSAFDWQLVLDSAIIRLGPIMQGVNAVAEQRLKAAIAAGAAKLGKTEKELSVHYGGGYTMMFAFTPGPPSEEVVGPAERGAQ